MLKRKAALPTCKTNEHNHAISDWYVGRPVVTEGANV